MTGIRVLCSGNADYQHDPIRLTSIIDGDFTPTKRTWVQYFEEPRERSWSVDCTRCRCSYRLTQSSVNAIAAFLEAHPELLDEDTVSTTILTGVIKRLPKVKAS